MTAPPLLAVNGLDVRFAMPDGEIHAVRGIDFDVGPGEAAAIVGESGSGKTQAMMAIMGLVAANGRVSGSARLAGEELIGLDRRRLNRIRGSRITMIFQEPMTSLDPLFPIGRQIAEPLMYHRRLGRRAARSRVLELLALVGIADARSRMRSYPHELSGGQRQRVMIAMALANDPDLLIADEPTTALDVTIQAQILELLAGLRRRFGMAVVLISHDLNIVRRFADRIYVVRDGEIVESGPTGRVAAAPRHPYTRMLLAAEPSGRKAAPAPHAPVLLEATDVCVTFVLGSGLGREAFVLRAVDGVSLTLRQGQTIGIVGESGSGKSTMGRVLVGLQAATGSVRYAGREIVGLGRKAMRPLRRGLQIVFQDPYGSLSPRLTAGEIVGEGLRVHEPGMSAAEREARSAAALAEVGLDPAMRNRYPHEFSGGQRQRIAIARVVILKPQVIILDEPTSALDRSVQKQIAELLRGLQETHGLAYIFISHDLVMVRAMADTIIVMKDGRIVEEGTTDAVFAEPREIYTRTLMAAAVDTMVFGDPDRTQRSSTLKGIPGQDR